jgi:hypothetical protein
MNEVEAKKIHIRPYFLLCPHSPTVTECDA